MKMLGNDGTEMESMNPTQLSGKSSPDCGISTSNSVEVPPGRANRESMKSFLHGMRGNKLIYESVDFRRDHENLLPPYLVFVTVYGAFRDK